ncbi:MAG: hypothetical protein ACHQ7N_22225, partial [Candidatus Methylomirabilales bacterium]
SMDAEENDETHTQELAKGLREDPRPLCPQFRGCDIQRLYPVQGYCVLAQSPGWFMVPSIEEYREHCTTPRFGECCWFRGTREQTGSAEGRRGDEAIRAEAWQPPDVGQATLRGGT